MSNSCHHIERIDNEFDPERCQGMIKSGAAQCNIKAVPGSKFCSIHGGASHIARSALKNLRLTIHRERVSELANSKDAYSLKDELGITRVLLEEIWNSCNSTADLMINSMQISTLVDKIASLTASCLKIELALNSHITQDTLIAFADEIVTIISASTDPETVIKISEKVQSFLKTLSPQSFQENSL